MNGKNEKFNNGYAPPKVMAQAGSKSLKEGYVPAKPVQVISKPQTPAPKPTAPAQKAK